MDGWTMTDCINRNDIVIRWTFGETIARETSPQALSLLEMSVKFARLLFPNTDRIICYNNLNERTQVVIHRIGKENDVDLLDVSDSLPDMLRNAEVKNSWWKYAPRRLDLNKYEIILDNDVILWDTPPTLRKAVEDDALVALSDAEGQYYGDFFDLVTTLQLGLQLNAGLIGMPRGFCPNLDKLKEFSLKDFFHSEQGFTALSFIEHQGPKYLIPLSEVQQLNVHQILADELISKYFGGHFCGCSYGYYDFWEERYSPIVRRKYLSLSKGAQIRTQSSWRSDEITKKD